MRDARVGRRAVAVPEAGGVGIAARDVTSADLLPTGLRLKISSSGAVPRRRFQVPGNTDED